LSLIEICLSRAAIGYGEATPIVADAPAQDRDEIRCVELVFTES